ncbi:MAG: ATPase [Deltaproteobacteria bacterium]|nr:ATPase [Deltaproteobacteria bacterium]
MKKQSNIFWGVDCGSSEIKVVALDDAGKLIHKCKTRTLFPLADHVRAALKGKASFPGPLKGDEVKAGHFIAITGYGRTHIDFIDERLTEIKSHYLGVHHQLNFEAPYTIIDIGGQDSKIIEVADGSVKRFVMNRKCAAGTGAFIEELAHRLELKLGDLSKLEKKHDKKIALNSYCTVFAATEVIKILMNGEKVENLIHAMYESVAKRVLEMTSITTDTVVLSGGVAEYHPALHGVLRERLGSHQELILAPQAQYCGAIGAALFVKDNLQKEQNS